MYFFVYNPSANNFPAFAMHSGRYVDTSGSDMFQTANSAEMMAEFDTSFRTFFKFSKVGFKLLEFEK